MYMNDWKALYQSRLVSAYEAVKHIPNDCRVFIGHAANQPPALVDAMCRNYMQYRNVELVHLVTLYNSEYCQPKMQGHLRFNGLFLSGSNRKEANSNLADFTPTHFGQCPKFFRDGTFPIDVALISVTPPNERGFCSLGGSVSTTKAATEQAKLVVAQVNDQFPRTYGDCWIHVSEINYFVEVSTPMPVDALRPDQRGRGSDRQQLRQPHRGRFHPTTGHWSHLGRSA